MDTSTSLKWDRTEVSWATNFSISCKTLSPSSFNSMELGKEPQVKIRLEWAVFKIMPPTKEMVWHN
jgi:hypothetical protein